MATATKKTAGRARKSATKAPSELTPAANAAVARASAAAGTKAAGKAIAAAATRVKRPLIIGGSAAAGVIGGLLVHRQATRSGRNGLSKVSLPMRDGNLDLHGLAAAAHKAGDIGRQLDEIGGAIDRVHGKKHG
jgi:hypothetical protein